MSTRPPIVDSHLHLWDPHVLDYPWLAATPELQRPYLPDDLDTSPWELRGAVVIEAGCSQAQRLQEVAWIQTQQDHGLHIAGLIASVALEAGNDLAPQLEALQQHPLVKGVRRNFQQETKDFITAPATLAGARGIIHASRWAQWRSRLRNGRLRQSPQRPLGR
jgi:L-fuconolactonase